MDVSVIIPMYNSESTIEKCVKSVLDQTYDGQLEILIVNDGSIDNSEKIVDKLISENNSKKIIKIINKKNGGVSSARNIGLNAAKGDLIALLDSDDEWFKNKLDIQIPYLKNRDFDFVATCRNDEKIGFPYKVINDEYAEIKLKKLLIKVVGQTSTVLFKRKILTNTGNFDENQKYSEDANYWMRISLNNKMIILNKSLVFTGGGKPAVGFSGLSANLEAMEEGVHKNIREMYSLGEINFLEFQLIRLFSKIKYLRRKIKVKRTL
ncbi:glycosyltransferase family 2 protein [Flavobacterium sp. H4147]|uniref:glycosyltransferase family 2 protein n=1 Tax=Flavobacterium sp. H4147 TaxID=3034149 RepID=UPI0023EC5A2E|nr:glycosyltransferase family 2 protein [Flavobacterium sp. H4147]